MNIFSSRRAALLGILSALLLFLMLELVHVPKLPALGVSLLVGFLVFSRMNLIP